MYSLHGLENRKYFPVNTKKIINTTKNKTGKDRLFPGALYSKVALSPLIKLSFSALDSFASGWAKRYCGGGILLR